MDRAIVIAASVIGLAAVAIAASLWEPMTEDSNPPLETAPPSSHLPVADVEVSEVARLEGGERGPSEEQRAQEYEEHLAAGRWGSPELEAALKDDSPAVRFRVLAQAASQGLTVPADVLEELALRDISANVRRLAVALLSTNSAVEPSRAERIATEASSDPDEAVQGTAAEILEHLESRHRADAEEPSYLRDAEEAIPR